MAGLPTITFDISIVEIPPPELDIDALANRSIPVAAAPVVHALIIEVRRLRAERDAPPCNVLDPPPGLVSPGEYATRLDLIREACSLERDRCTKAVREEAEGCEVGDEGHDLAARILRAIEGA